MAFNFKNIDTSKLVAGKISLGTEEQDCTVISKFFEHAAHSTPSEVAALAPLSRQLNNSSGFAGNAKKTLSSYLMGSQLAAKGLFSKASNMSSNYSTFASGAASKSASFDELMSGAKFPDFNTAIPGTGQFGKKMAQMIKECTPCALRPLSFADLNPTGTLLKAHESFINSQLAIFSNMISMFNNFNSHSDLCSLINSTKDICILDLQRMLVMLMAKLAFDTPKMDGMMNMLQQLVAPLFMSTMQAIGALMDQLVQLVTAPAQCIIDSLNSYTAGVTGVTSAASAFSPSENDDVTTSINKMSGATEGIESSIEAISEAMAVAKKAIEAKLDFYIEEIEGLMGETGASNSNYLGFAMKKMTAVRQIMFIQALIIAKVSGASICKSEGKSASKSELDNFFNNFLNPLSPYKMWLADDGNIKIQNNPQQYRQMDILSKDGTPIQFSPKQLLDPSVESTTMDIAYKLNNPQQEVIIPCSFANAGDKAQEINQWVREMDQTL